MRCPCVFTRMGISSLVRMPRAACRAGISCPSIRGRPTLPSSAGHMPPTCHSCREPAEGNRAPTQLGAWPGLHSPGSAEQSSDRQSRPQGRATPTPHSVPYLDGEGTAPGAEAVVAEDADWGQSAPRRLRHSKSPCHSEGPSCHSEGRRGIAPPHSLARKALFARGAARVLRRSWRRTRIGGNPRQRDSVIPSPLVIPRALPVIPRAAEESRPPDAIPHWVRDDIWWLGLDDRQAQQAWFAGVAARQGVDRVYLVHQTGGMEPEARCDVTGAYCLPG